MIEDKNVICVRCGRKKSYKNVIHTRLYGYRCLCGSQDWKKRKSNSPEKKLLIAIELNEKAKKLDNRDLVAAVIEHESLLDKPIDSWELALIEELMNRVYPGWYNIFYPEKKET